MSMVCESFAARFDPQPVTEEFFSLEFTEGSAKYMLGMQVDRKGIGDVINIERTRHMDLFDHWYQKIIPEHIKSTGIYIRKDYLNVVVNVVVEFNLKLQPPQLDPLPSGYRIGEDGNLHGYKKGRYLNLSISEAHRQNLSISYEDDESITIIPLDDNEALLWQAIYATTKNVANRTGNIFDSPILGLYWRPGKDSAEIRLQVRNNTELTPMLENFTQDIVDMMMDAEQKLSAKTEDHSFL